MADEIIYEQPLNEHLRVCLRLEHLFQRIEDTNTVLTPQHNQTTIHALLDVVNVLDRPDIKGKFTTALMELRSYLTKMLQTPQVNNEKLQYFLTEIEQANTYLEAIQGKIGQSLRENEFLNDIRLNLSKPGGTANFNCPGYHLWLEQSEELRQQCLNEWQAELVPIQKIANLLLQMIRASSELQNKFANQGFFQQSLSLQIPYQLIRISVSNFIKAYPEISVGRHRLSVHFFTPNFGGRPVHVTNNIPFKLACCGYT